MLQKKTQFNETKDMALRFNTINGKLKKELLALRNNPGCTYIRLVEYYEQPELSRNSNMGGGFGTEEYRSNDWDAFERDIQTIFDTLGKREPGKSILAEFSIDFCEWLDGKMIYDNEMLRTRFSKFL